MKNILFLFLLVFLCVSVNAQKTKIKKEGLTFYKEIDKFEGTCKIQSPWIGLSGAYKLRFGKTKNGNFLKISAAPFALSPYNYDIDDVQILMNNDVLLNISIQKPTKQIEYTKSIKNGRHEILIFVLIDNEQAKILSEGIVKGVRAKGSFEYVNKDEKKVKNHKLFSNYVSYIIQNDLCSN